VIFYETVPCGQVAAAYHHMRSIGIFIVAFLFIVSISCITNFANPEN
jgi:hypothetical protein